MKFLLKFLFVFYFILPNCFSQNTLVSVTYKLSKGNGVKQNVDKIDEASTKTNEVLSGVSKNLELVEFIMYCNEYSSIYFIIDKMQIAEDFTYKIASRLGGNGIYYKNIKKKIKINQKDALGEKLNILYDYDEYEWKITQETKMISGYKCFKAVSTIEEYDYLKKSKIILKPEVWFTPEIPVPFGPKGFDGLPGLILEATNNGKTFIYASKIQFNPENINEILTEPKGGNDIAKDDYLKILAEKINE